MKLSNVLWCMLITTALLIWLSPLILALACKFVWLLTDNYLMGDAFWDASRIKIALLWVGSPILLVMFVGLSQW